ncbi:MAG: PASTA domain-containing protein, partial [Synergistes sp.]|nr:PASTA domain-containing protein [Synergistes sp.]
SPLPADVVVSQNLAGGEKVARGKVVLLRVSKGGAARPIPDVRGLRFEEGVKRLGDSGFKIKKVNYVQDKIKPAGTIIAQNPASPQQVASNCMVSLLVSSGANGRNAFVTVPNVRGQNQDAAIELLEQLGLRVGEKSTAASNSMPAGSIISTRPKQGTKVPANSLVSIVIAREPIDEFETANDVPPTNDLDKERAETVRKVVIKETKPVSIPTKLPVIDESTIKKSSVGKKTAASTSSTTTTPQTKTEAAKSEKPAVKQEETTKQQTAHTQAEPSVPAATASTKNAKIRYQVPPLAKPLSLKIEMTDDRGTHVLKDSVANSGEYISMNVPYQGEARITIFLGGD